MPVMENHSKHSGSFASAGLAFLAAAPGWKAAKEQAVKFTNAPPEGMARKRLLATIIFVLTAADCANKRVIDGTFEKITGHSLAPGEAKTAFSILMLDKTQELHEILEPASKKERHTLLRAVVMTWSAHGMDSQDATLVTERIVALLGFDQDAICKTLDRLWLKDQATTGVQTTYKLTRVGFIVASRATLRGAKATAEVLAPRARRIGRRAFAAIQR